jgi:hypothetical protein
LGGLWKFYIQVPRRRREGKRKRKKDGVGADLPRRRRRDAGRAPPLPPAGRAPPLLPAAAPPLPPAGRRRDSSPAACSRSGHRRLGRRCRRPGLRRSRLLPGRHRRGGGLRAHGSPQCLSPRGVRSAMAPPPPHRPYKRPAISDQQRRRDLALQAQSARRADAQARARSLANSLLSPSSAAADTAVEGDSERDHEPTVAEAASKLRGSDARRWFARQIMLPEWMADAPPHLATDWLLPSPPSPNSFSLLLRISIRVPLLC